MKYCFGNGDLQKLKELQLLHLAADKGNRRGVLRFEVKWWIFHLGKVEAMKVLISRGLEVDARNEEQETPLHKAAWHGILLKFFYWKHNQSNVFMWRKLSNFQIADRVEIAKILIKHGANVNAKDGIGQRTPLHLVAVNGSVALARVLCDNGADVNALNAQSDSPLSVAILHCK